VIAGAGQVHGLVECLAVRGVGRPEDGVFEAADVGDDLLGARAHLGVLREGRAPTSAHVIDELLLDFAGVDLEAGDEIDEFLGGGLVKVELTEDRGRAIDKGSIEGPAFRGGEGIRFRGARRG
jgi:hypothetical protein